MKVLQGRVFQLRFKNGWVASVSHEFSPINTELSNCASWREGSPPDQMNIDKKYANDDQILDFLNEVRNRK